MANTTAILIALKRTKFQSMVESDLHAHTAIAQGGPGEPIERWHFLRHLVEQALDGHESILPRDVVDQFVQEFPFGTRIAGRFDGLPETLHAALDVRERTALFGVGATRQEIVRRGGGLVRKDVADNERLQSAKQLSANAVLRHVFAEDNERFDRANLDAFGNGREPRAHRARGDPGESRAEAVWILVRTDEQRIPFANARDGVGDRTKPYREFLQKEQLLIGLSRGSNDSRGANRHLAKQFRDFPQHRRPTLNFGL